jgi:hypothetical protein
MSLRVPGNPGNLLTGWRRVSFSWRNLLHGVSKYENILQVRHCTYQRNIEARSQRKSNKY